MSDERIDQLIQEMRQQLGVIAALDGQIAQRAGAVELLTYRRESELERLALLADRFTAARRRCG